MDIYSLNEGENKLFLHNPTLLISNSDLLLELISYRWTQILETCNSSPKIANKVKGTAREKLKRSATKKFRKYLDLENPEKICFLTDTIIEEGESDVHHVIPWSYLYSDDLWNLVYTKKSANLQQSNKLPTKKMIKKLEKRNLELLNCMKTNLTRHKKTAELDKPETELKNHLAELENQTAELEIAIESKYVEQFWLGCKG